MELSVGSCEMMKTQNAPFTTCHEENQLSREVASL